MELENRLKASDMKNRELEVEIGSLEKIQNTQKEELVRITNTQEFNSKVKYIISEHIVGCPQRTIRIN